MQQAGPGYLAVATRMHFQRYLFIFLFLRQSTYNEYMLSCCLNANKEYLLYSTLCPIRTAGLEQEIESLKKKLAACSRDNLNLEEELSEAYRIKVSY